MKTKQECGHDHRYNLDGTCLMCRIEHLSAENSRLMDRVAHLSVKLAKAQAKVFSLQGV